MVNLRLLIIKVLISLLIPSLINSSEDEGIKVILPISLNLTVLTDPSAVSAASHDFGNITTVIPAGVLCPFSPADISRLLLYANYVPGNSQPPAFKAVGRGHGRHRLLPDQNSAFKVAVRGHGHSLNGQASVAGGVVVNMSCLAKSRLVVVSEDGTYADVAGGMLWVDVLTATTTAAKAVSPVSWTDYLYLSVGGTLSNAGIGGNVFRNGPQISNVLELDVITGKGEMLTCSRQLNSELFYGVLGGLGQFGIITRARIALAHAPQRVKWFRILYIEFTAFTKDQERLISLTNETVLGVDYLEGQLMMSNGVVDTSFFPPSDQSKVADLVKNHRIIYVLEVAKYYDDPNSPIIGQVIDMLNKTLSYVPGFMFMQDVTNFDFLNRVRPEEQKLRSLGLWEVPHPWLNLFVPKSRILDFHNGVIKEILLNQNSTSGFTLFYPINRNKWDDRMSAMIPEEDVFYVVGFLQSAGQQNLSELENINKNIIMFCKESNIKIKQYLMHFTQKQDWVDHFDSKWSDFLRRKDMFDPKKLLAPGHNIF